MSAVWCSNTRQFLGSLLSFLQNSQDFCLMYFNHQWRQHWRLHPRTEANCKSWILLFFNHLLTLEKYCSPDSSNLIRCKDINLCGWSLERGSSSTRTAASWSTNYFCTTRLKIQQIAVLSPVTLAYQRTLLCSRHFRCSFVVPTSLTSAIFLIACCLLHPPFSIISGTFAHLECNGFASEYCVQLLIPTRCEHFWHFFSPPSSTFWGKRPKSQSGLLPHSFGDKTEISGKNALLKDLFFLLYWFPGAVFCASCAHYKK